MFTLIKNVGLKSKVLKSAGIGLWTKKDNAVRLLNNINIIFISVYICLEGQNKSLTALYEKHFCLNLGHQCNTKTNISCHSQIQLFTNSPVCFCFCVTMRNVLQTVGCVLDVSVDQLIEYRAKLLLNYTFVIHMYTHACTHRPLLLWSLFTTPTPTKTNKVIIQVPLEKVWCLIGITLVTISTLNLLSLFSCYVPKVVVLEI